MRAISQTNLNVRLPRVLAEAVAEVAAKKNTTMSSFTRRALMLALAAEWGAAVPPKNGFENVRCFCNDRNPPPGAV